jgi:hypothetical protein
MSEQRTLRIHLVLEISVPKEATVFQALTVAFWRFQGLAATTLFTAVLKALEARARADMEQRHPGRFRDKGHQGRIWELPFGSVRLALDKLVDRYTGRTVYPLKEAMDLPKRVTWGEDTLLPGYRLAVLQSFRESNKAVEKTSPDGRAPHHSTLHRRFQGFAEHLDPVPDLAHRRGSKPAAFQQADGTKLAMQDHGRSVGQTDLRLVVGSRMPQGRLEVLDFSLGDAWEKIAERLRQRFPTPPKALVSDGEPGISESLGGPDTVHQRCLVHARRNLKYALYQDRVKGTDQVPFVDAFAQVPGLMACQVEVNRLASADRTTLTMLLSASEQAFAALQRRLPSAEFPHTRQYVLGLIESGLTYLRQLLAGGPAILVSTNRTESLMSRLALRLKRIGKRWSVPGAQHMLAAVLTTALHPERYEQVEALLRGEDKPVVSILITSLETAWVT